MEDEVFFDDDTVGITPIGDASKVHVCGVVGESHIRAKLLKASLAIWTVTVRVNQAAYCSKVAWFKLGD
jgi:hypothetical protein